MANNLSSGMQKLLALMGETSLDLGTRTPLGTRTTSGLLNSKTTKAIDPNHKWNKNKGYYERIESDRTEVIKRAVEAVQREEPRTIIDALVMFTQRISCRGCQSIANSVQYPQLFERHRRILPSGKLDPLSAIYRPIKGWGNHLLSLPRLRIHTNYEVLICDACYEAHDLMTSHEAVNIGSGASRETPNFQANSATASSKSSTSSEGTSSSTPPAAGQPEFASESEAQADQLNGFHRESGSNSRADASPSFVSSPETLRVPLFDLIKETSDANAEAAK